MEGEPLTFLGRPVGAGFRASVVTILPGRSRPYDEAEWRDALVVVEAGEIDVECRAGGHRRFGTGAVLCLTGMPLRILRNTGSEPAVLVAVSRR